MSYGLIAYTAEGRLAFKFDTRFTTFKQKISVVLPPGTSVDIYVPGINQNWLVCVSATPGFPTYNWIESYIVPNYLHIQPQAWYTSGTTTAYVDVLLFESRVFI